MKNTLTDKQYWNANYQERGALKPLSLEGARNLCNARIFEIKERYGVSTGSVLEIGGGGSSWLAFLAQRYPGTSFAALDYSDDGADLLESFKREAAVDNLAVHKRDFFDAHDDVGEHDFVYSHGVVEHFEDLPATMSAHARYLKSTGAMFTLIPNLAGVLGPLTRWMSRDVYDIHVPHDLESFTKGHESAGLEIIESGYLCSSNFGVLSSCVNEEEPFRRFVYRQLARFSTAMWMVESRVTRIPATRLLSPYIYVVSRKRPGSGLRAATASESVSGS